MAGNKPTGCMKNKPDLLFMLKMPPPHTGATVMNALVYNSALLADAFSIARIGISYSRSVKDLGSFSLRKYKVFAVTFFRLLHQLVLRRPRIIYFQPSITGGTYIRDLVFIMTGRLFRKKFILHLHGKGIRAAAEKSALFAALYRLGFKGQYLIVLSNEQKNDVAFLKPAAIFVVNNGSALLAAGEPEPQQGPFRFLFLSNLLKSKGLFDLVEVAKELKDAGYDFRLDIVGNEGDISGPELTGRVEALGLSGQVQYHGPKYGNDKLPYFRKADAFVFPTRNDAFGLVLIEAMQFGLPVIASNEGAIPEIVGQGQSGFVYPKGDNLRLKEHMAALIGNPALAREMGKKGREIYFEKFTIHAFETNLQRVFNDILKDPRQQQ